MMAPVSPRDRALAAIEAFERTSPVLLGGDRELLDRLRSREYATQIDQIWSAIEKLRKTPDDDVIVIKNAVCAFNIADTYWHLPDELRKQKRRDANAKKAICVLRDYFKEKSGADQLQQSLSWASSIIDRSGERFGGLKPEDDGTITSMPKWFRLGRERKTPAAKRVLFMAAMSETFRGLFGKPCDDAVAALTDVAFQNPTTVDQVRDAWRRTGQLTKK